MWTPRQIVDAADYLDRHTWEGAHAYAPLGLSEGTREELDALMVAAIAAGFGFEIRGL